MRYLLFLVVFVGVFHSDVFCQKKSPINRQQFFLDDSLIEVTLTTDIRNLRTQKKTPTWQPAQIKMHFTDSLVVNEEVRVEPRGIVRKEICDLASLFINFKNTTSPILSPLKKLKLVSSCNIGNTNEEFLLKEYLIYKIYNLLSVMSYRVRLLHITYVDSKQKIKTYSQYGFLIEDTKDMADRNNCKEIQNKHFSTEQTDRHQMTFVSIFQYMIGNTDWAVGNYHNIKLMVPKTDTLARPYPVPYDFDYAGFVNAPYAVPAEGLDLTNVTERYYMGFARSIEEIQAIMDVFNEKKETIYLTINKFTRLSDKIKKEMTRYLDQFYDSTDSKGALRSIFVDKAF